MFSYTSLMIFSQLFYDYARDNRLRVNLVLPQTGQQAARENVIQMAKNAESEGFDSLWVFERLLWPINPQTPYVATPDGSLSVEYQNIFVHFEHQSDLLV